MFLPFLWTLYAFHCCEPTPACSKEALTAVIDDGLSNYGLQANALASWLYRVPERRSPENPESQSTRSWVLWRFFFSSVRLRVLYRVGLEIHPSIFSNNRERLGCRVITSEPKKSNACVGILAVSSAVTTLLYTSANQAYS